jgi:hypothetical protein
MKVKIKRLKIILLLAISWISVNGQHIDVIGGYPNPFYDTLNISFELYAQDTVSLKAFQINGSSKTVLFEDSLLSAGVYDVAINLDTLIPARYLIWLYINGDIREGITVTKSEFPLSINKLPNQQISTFYPNPSSGILFTINQDLERITIYDLKGRRVKELLNVGQTIDCSNLPDGTYIFRIKLTTGEERFQLIEMVN